MRILGITHLNQWSLMEDDFAPASQGTCLDSLTVSTGEGLLLASSVQRPRMLLNILHGSGQPPTTESHPAPNVNAYRTPDSKSRKSGHSA